MAGASPLAKWFRPRQQDRGCRKDLTWEQLNELKLVAETLSEFDELKMQDEGNIRGDRGNDRDGDAVSEKSYDFDPTCESHWIKVDKIEPWQQKSDRDELASMVFHKSFEDDENCDLPPPRKSVRHGRASSNAGKKMTEVSDWEMMSNEGHLLHLSILSDIPSSRPMQKLSGAELGQDELLEALRHSQTRAREAEAAARRASAEKDDVVKLFFKQASQLFAYKQWLHLLQLETACFQMKKNNLLPPWRGLQKVSKTEPGRRGRKRNNSATYVVAFALGFSLVGAGFLLGWTVGWMFPTP